MAKRPNQDGGLPADFRSLAQLPLSPDEVWQAEICRSPAWMRIAGQPQRPWMALVTNRTEDLVLAHEMPNAQPTPKLLQEKLAEAMRSAEFGAPHRPCEVQVRSDELRAELRAPLEAVGIRCDVAEELEHVDFVLRDLAKHLQGGRTVPALVDAPGVGTEQIRSYFEAAAAYYRQSPWRRVPGDTPDWCCTSWSTGRPRGRCRSRTVSPQERQRRANDSQRYDDCLATNGDQPLRRDR